MTFKKEVSASNSGHWPHSAGKQRVSECQSAHKRGRRCSRGKERGGAAQHLLITVKSVEL